MQQLDQIIKLQAIRPKTPANEKSFNLAECESRVTQLTKIFKEQAYFWSQENEMAYEIDTENIDAIKSLILYHAKHPNFMLGNSSTRGSLSLRKGLIICGNTGSGKTLLMKLFNQCLVERLRYNVVPCDVIADRVTKRGIEALEAYQRRFFSICFDDLGLENKPKYYGNEINSMFDIIIKRYRLFTDNKTISHFTTNLRPDEWITQYDQRTASRLKEMCNIIVLGGKKDSQDKRENQVFFQPQINS